MNHDNQTFVGQRAYFPKPMRKSYWLLLRVKYIITAALHGVKIHVQL